MKNFKFCVPVGAVFACLLLVFASGCSRQPSEEASSQGGAPHDRPVPASPQQQEIAGTIFGTPVPLGNYRFAKRAAFVFQAPGWTELSREEQEQRIWQNLILHFEATRRGLTVSDEELERAVNQILTEHEQAFTRSGDPAAYEQWVRDTVQEDVALFENQVAYLELIEALKQQVRKAEEADVTVTEAELHEEFLNEKHHVAGDYRLFDAKEEAQAFYEAWKEPGKWEQATQADPAFARPFSMITLEAIIDLWGVPRDQIYAFHAMPLGSVGAPLPFGTQWGVFRLLEKRTGDLTDFPAEAESYRRQVTSKKSWAALQARLRQIEADANLQILLPPD